MVNNIHYNYIIVGKSNKTYTLLNEENIEALYNLFLPLVAFTDVKKARISTIQYAKEPDYTYHKAVKVGKVKWSLGDLESICTKYKSYLPDNFRSLMLKAEFPSITSAYKKGTTSEIVLRIENDSFKGRMNSEGECGIVLSIREDVFDKMGEKLVNNLLKEVILLLDESRVIFKKRVFFAHLETESMMDASASRYRDPLYNKLYKDWEVLSL